RPGARRAAGRAGEPPLPPEGLGQAHWPHSFTAHAGDGFVLLLLVCVCENTPVRDSPPESRTGVIFVQALELAAGAGRGTHGEERRRGVAGIRERLFDG